MARKNGNGGESSQQEPLTPSPPELQRRAPSGERLRPRADLFLVICRIFGVITALSAILCIAVNVFSAIRSFKDGSDVFDGIFRCYAVVVAVFVILAETEWSLVFKFWMILEYWVGRGMLQIFVAVMTRAFPDYSDEEDILVLLQNIACYMLLACGVIYVVSGILCMGILKRARQKKEITRDQAVNDLERRLIESSKQMMK
ncbi:hypothetical protein V2J09_002539 [Rumex salicifolius]